MQYIITFLEGIISFISPCVLPMIPIYISYFAGDAGNKKHTVLRAILFVAGFTLIFSLLGIFAGTLGVFLKTYKETVNIICGVAVILFGLSFLDIIHLNFFKGIRGSHTVTDAFSAFIFGIVFSVSLTPCVGAFAGSALMLAGTAGTVGKGALLLFCYSLGLGIPFVISAILIDKLNSVFLFIKNHYKLINTVCGVFLIAVGILMAFGFTNKFIDLIS